METLFTSNIVDQQIAWIVQVMKAMEREKEELESEKSDLENQFEALKLMVEPYRY